MNQCLLFDFSLPGVLGIDVILVKMSGSNMEERKESVWLAVVCDLRWTRDLYSVFPALTSLSWHRRHPTSTVTRSFARPQL